MKILFMLFLLVISSCSLMNRDDDNPWTRLTTPSEESTESIGSHSKGCLQGAQSLQAEGVGYQFMALYRGSFYGHPSLLNYIERLGKKVSSGKLGELAVGDLSMPRGGPYTWTHGSHQIGLDVDIWLELLPLKKKLTLAQRAAWPIRVVVENHDEITRKMNEKWNADLELMVQMAADDNEVERIFINPELKKYFCQKYPNENWAKKLRSWWGHHEHIHVRLRCPENSKDCVPQSELTDDGCGESLAWWWSEDYVKTNKERLQTVAWKMPQLPNRCLNLMK